MRFMSAQVVALLEGDLWARSAAHANAMAALLAAEVAAIPGVRAHARRCRPTRCSRGCPARRPTRVRERFPFYTWDEATGEVRWMCSWDTTPEDVHAFTAALRGAGASVAPA